MVRYFLDWDAPFIGKVIDWLWERQETLAETLIVVPTAEAGRKVRQALAERGACLAPQVCTAGRFGAMGYQGEENLLLEQIIWEETLEGFAWEECKEVFPKPRADRWAQNLSEELRRLRVQTGEYGMTFHAVAQRLPEGHLDRQRWGLLARWEKQYYAKMMAVDAQDSYQVRNADYAQAKLSSKFKEVVLIGVTDPTEQAARMARATAQNGVKVSVLISAPEEVAEGFDEVGRPLADYWEDKKLHWQRGNEDLHCVADARTLGSCLLERLAETLTEDTLSLGVGDKEVAPVLKSQFQKKGYAVFDPAGTSIRDWSFIDWFRVWVRFSKGEQVSDLRVLVRSPWTARLMETVGKDYYWISRALEDVSQSAKPVDIADLWHLKQTEWPFDGRDEEKRRARLNQVLDVVQGVKEWRAIFKRPVPPAKLRAFLMQVLGGEESDEALVAEKVFSDLEDEAARLPESHGKRFDFSQEYLKRLEKERISDSRDKVQIEALGWLELAFEPSPHLYITGLNEGVLPNTEIGDTWLPESLREQLGMRTNRERYAHDVFYLKSLLEARRENGRVSCFFLKAGPTGEPLKPSRLLLQVPREELAARVSHCFSNTFYSIPPLPWQRDWKLSSPEPQEIKKLSPSSIKDYLVCPFRFYLKHVLRMQKPSETLQEWNNGEFGVIIHEVLENMQGNEEILKETNQLRLEKWFHNELDQIIEKQFSEHPALAFQIQRESIRQRLSFFSHVETEDRLNNPGWRAVAFEEPFALMIDGIKIGGIIDRIDEHEDGRLRVVDYKTGKAEAAEKAHYVKVTAATNVPPHLEDTDVFFTKNGNDQLWTNLQLPIYALHCKQKWQKCPTLRYGQIGKTVADNAYSDWDFTEEELEVAQKAVTAVVQKVKSGVFYPPVERPRNGYDDFSGLAYGYPLSEATEQGAYKLVEKPDPAPPKAAAVQALTQGNLNL